MPDFYSSSKRNGFVFHEHSSYSDSRDTRLRKMKPKNEEVNKSGGGGDKLISVFEEVLTITLTYLNTIKIYRGNQ